MSENAPQLDVDAFADPSSVPPQCVIVFEGAEIPVQFTPAKRPTNALIIRFHGAVDRAVRPLPTFQPNRPEFSPYAHQISICDPTIMTRDGFTLGWYLGHEQLDLQRILTQFFIDLTRIMSISRVVYVGGSGGGFAALNYSFRQPGSIAVVMVPQTSIAAYGRRSLSHVPLYLENYWSGRALEQLPPEIETDLNQLYRNGHGNSIVYLQSSGDQPHTALHLAPFFKTTHQWKGEARENRNFVLVSGYWGRPGHSGAVPPAAFIPWIRAAIAAQSRSGDDIRAAYTQIASDSSGAINSSARKGSFDADQFDKESLRLADWLRDYHLGRKEAV